ncbi:MAG: hypothetical protein H0T89_05045, partial [Deltaproteobacteria bacterium]|nr:hypothetical protein [Deltaproteobacteria bacterium]
AFAILGYAGYFGIIAGLWSRRASTVFVATTALVLLVGLCDAPYLALDLAPGKGGARLGTERLAQLARPFVAAAGAYTIAIVLRHAIASWVGAPRRHQLIAAAIASVLAMAALRAVPSVWRSASDRAYSETQVVAPDRAGRAELVRWAAARASELRPDAWARAVFETDTHEHFHLTAITGLPTFHLAPQPDLLLRERIENLSPPSLRRFNVRWAIASDRSPTLGDPASEKIIGTFHIREIREWDGQLARIERGTGQLRVLALDSTHVEIDVTASEPVFVVLGTGYYPRWRARHASGVSEPVYAVPSIEGGTLHVVGAWVAPGRTTFTVDGPLPSDHDGRLLAIAALLLALAGIITWSRRRWRLAILRRLARLRCRLPAVISLAIRIGVPLVLVMLFARGCADRGGPMRALELGTGLRPSATVEARLVDGDWETCGYNAITAIFACDQLLVAYDGMASLLNDAPPSWGFNTPAIVASAHRTDVEMRVRVDAELDGTYWMAASDRATVVVSGEASREIDRAIVTYARGPRTIEVRAAVPTSSWQLTMVHEETLVPARPFLAAPPAIAPASVRAIGDRLQ